VDTATTHQVDGSVSNAGGVTVERTGPSQFVSCPICLVRGTLIDTPLGPLAVELVRAGSAVYTAGADGKRLAVTVLRVGSSPAPANHRVLTIRLSDGRSVTASPNHPTADGRPLSSLRPSDTLDGAVIMSIAEHGYDGGRTYDLLPAGSTGAYWADGVLLGSTLRR
jgi:hypothetical protein